MYAIGTYPCDSLALFEEETMRFQTLMGPHDLDMSYEPEYFPTLVWISGYPGKGPYDRTRVPGFPGTNEGVISIVHCMHMHIPGYSENN